LETLPIFVGFAQAIVDHGLRELDGQVGMLGASNCPVVKLDGRCSGYRAVNLVM